MNFNQRRFMVWLEVCNQLVVDKLGVGINDLEDFLWRDRFDDDYTPEEAVEEFLESLGVY